METIRGRRSLELELNRFKERLAGYHQIKLDLGTGDGRYVRALAEKHPEQFVIGLDACRENLREHSQAKLENMLFIIASAQELPNELNGLISHISINFPWGSLLESLLSGDSKLMRGLESISQATAAIHLHLNGGAMAENDTTLEAGAEKIYSNLRGAGWQTESPRMMDRNVLRSFPSTWAKRLAFGRDPRAIQIKGHFAR